MLKLGTSPIQAIKSNCLDNIEASRTVGESRSIATNFTSEDWSTLDFKLTFHQDVGVKIQLFDKINGGGSINLDIENTLKLSSKTIAIIGIIEYFDSIAFINYANMTPEAKILYENNRYQFEQQYGTGYVEKVELGERLIAVFTYTFKDYKNYTKLDFKAAADAYFLGIFNGDSHTNLNMDETEFEQNTEIHSYCYSTGNFLPGFIGTREDFVSQYNAWIVYTNNKINSPGARFSVINKIYQPYSKILALQDNTSLDVYAEMLYAWKSTASQIRIVLNDTSDSVLIQNCRDALILIQQEIEKCQVKAVDARYPKVDEFPAIQKLWIRKTSLPLYKLNASYSIPIKYFLNIPLIGIIKINQTDKQSLDYYLASTEEKLAEKIDQLKKNNPNIFFQYEKCIDYIPQLNIPDSIPLFALFEPKNGLIFFTTDKEERNRKMFNEGYTLSAEGAIIGYLLQQPLYDFNSFYKIQIKISNQFQTNFIASTGARFILMSVNLPRVIIFTSQGNEYSPPT